MTFKRLAWATRPEPPPPAFQQKATVGHSQLIVRHWVGTGSRGFGRLFFVQWGLGT